MVPFGGGLLISMIRLVIAEVGKFFLPKRTPDWREIGWGLGQILIGSCLAHSFGAVF